MSDRNVKTLNKALLAVLGNQSILEAATRDGKVDPEAWTDVIDEAWSGNVHRWSSVLDPLNQPTDRNGPANAK
jgi:hypothetical protein